MVPTRNGGQGSCFLPKTDKQVSHSDSDGLTPGSSVRRVINVAYLLGTELCVFSVPPKKMSTFQNENIHFSHWVSPLLLHSFSFSQRKERLVTRGDGEAEKHLKSLPYIHTRSFGDSKMQ